MTVLGRVYAWLRREQGWVCQYGYNHYLFGCRPHQCLNRDGVVRRQRLPRHPALQRRAG